MAPLNRSEMVGTQLGPYRIDDRLGEGGMGVVYRAWDVRLERQVALKVLPTGIRASDDSRERLAREARAAATLNHPNIAAVYDIGEADGHLYIAIELIDGETLDDHSGGHPMDPASVRRIGSQVARGLAAAHAAGVVHRDVKPGNVMVRPDGVVKLLDFGLAKQEGAEELTKQGSTLGTVAYMSPEQARAEEAGPESDLWSLGVILYELVTGTRPFAGTYETAILYAVLNEAPPSPRDANPDCPDDLNDLIMELLSKERSERLADASHVADRLSGATATLAAPIPAGFAVSPRAVGGMAAVLVVLIAATAIWWSGQASDRRWVEDEGLPTLREIGPLSPAAPVAQRSRAFEVARRVLELDPSADSLRGMYLVSLTLHSEPEGAAVSMAADSAGHRIWRSIGTTPLQGALVPYGYDDVRLELDGYDRFETNLITTQDLVDTLKLVATGTVPPGMTMAESTYERPLRLPGLEHIVRAVLAPYAIDRYEVTNERYQAFVDDGGYGNSEWWTVPVELEGQGISFDASRALFIDQTGRPGPATWTAGRYPQGEGDYPVRGVSWYEAAAFAAWDGGQLPTVFHWEAAAVPGLAEHLMNTANIGYREGPMPVGASGSMGFGLYDAAGNVREWVWNREPNRNLRFVLGGAWSDDPYRFVDAYAADPLERDPGTGFRTMAADPEGDPELRRPLTQPFRDYTEELPVTDLEFERMMGFFAYDPQPLEARETLVDSTDADVAVWRIEFDAGYGERMYAFLYLPKRSPAPHQPILYFPGDGNWNSGTPAVPFDPGFFAWDFARDGRAVFAPVFRNTNDRLGAIATSTPDMSVAYRDHVVMWSKEVRRSVDYLAARSDMDMDRLSYFGVSWGAMMAPAMIATEPRFKVSVLYVGGLLFQPSRPEVDMFNFLPRVTIPTLMVNGRYDFYFPYLTSQVPFFDHLGTPADLRELKVYDGAHGAPPGVILRETISWLDRFLGPPGR